MKKQLITIGFDKNGQADFGVRTDLADLPIDKLRELREIVVVAIWCAEDMWRRNQKQELGESVKSN